MPDVVGEYQFPVIGGDHWVREPDTAGNEPVLACTIRQPPSSSNLSVNEAVPDVDLMNI
jgi:hypothetical protein